MLQNLSRLRVVLVNTSHPGNIGAVARAMKNMGIHQLQLVQPLEFPSAEAEARASGASDILQQAVVVDDLAAALQGCGMVVGASARLRTIPWPVIDPRECGNRVIEFSNQDAEQGTRPDTLQNTGQDGGKDTGPTEVAIVMGRERTGLTNEELELCNYLVHIPANPDYSSLNIAAATQVLLYEVRMAALEKSGQRDNRFKSDHPFATFEEMEGLYAHFETALTELGFLRRDNPRQLMRRLRRLFNRSQLDRMEVNILRGILGVAQSGGKGKHRPDESE